MKTREDHETVVSDGDVLARVFETIGLRVWFRYQKYREEFAPSGTTIAIDNTPVGTFVEIEGTSYRTLFLKRRLQFGMSGNDMVFSWPARRARCMTNQSRALPLLFPQSP